MKKIVLLILILVLGLFLSGCFLPTVPSDVKDVEIKVTAFEQEAYLGAKALKVFNGEDLKCGPPPCDCDRCCPECSDCDSCCNCEECEECEECPTCEECPSCPCYQIKWGDLIVDYEVWNVGNVDVEVCKICFTISFQDDTTIERCVDTDVALLVGENIEKEVEINLPIPVKRVTFVEVKSVSFN